MTVEILDQLLIHTVHRKGIEMEDKSEEISISAGAAEHLDQRTFPNSEIFPASRQMLTPREREIAIAAVSARAGGSPVEAAKQVLAGIAVLDGCHSPILVWPENTTRSEKAAWHAAEAAYWEESAKSFAEFELGAAQSAVRTQPSSRDGRSIGEQGVPLPLSASSAATLHALETQSPLHSELGGLPQESSDAC